MAQSKKQAEEATHKGKRRMGARTRTLPLRAYPDGSPTKGMIVARRTMGPEGGLRTLSAKDYNLRMEEKRVAEEDRKARERIQAELAVA